MSRYQCWNCSTHHNGDYEQCNECTSKGRDKPTMWRPGPNYVPPTNADIIRRMSDKELADLLADWDFCSDVCSLQYSDNPLVGKCPENCKEQALGWLQHPAKEDT